MSNNRSTRYRKSNISRTWDILQLQYFKEIKPKAVTNPYEVDGSITLLEFRESQLFQRI